MTALLEEKPASVTSRSAEQGKLLEQYSVGPIQFTGTNDALYERHLVFDNVMEPATIGARERFEAVARFGARRPFAAMDPDREDL